MAPLPSNNTAVLFVDYTVAGEGHTLQCRFVDPATAVQAQDAVEQFLTAIDGSLFDMQITGSRVRAAASTVTLPLAWTGATSFGGVAGPHNASANYVDFIGRSIAGRRVRVAVFGWNTVVDSAGADYRYPDTGDVAAGLDVLRATVNIFVAIDGEEVIWYDYANGGINAYWRNTIR